MMRLYFLRSHEHDITDIEQIDPIESLFLTFIIMILSNSKLISLCLFIKVAFLFHSVDFLGWHEAHSQLFHQLSGDLVLAFAGVLELILENDVDELLLMFFEL